MEYLNDFSVLVFFLILTRLSGMLVIAPFFSASQIPNTVKICMAICISLVIFPIVVTQTPISSVPNDLIIFGIIAIKELLVGLLIGFAAVLIITSVMITGQYASLVMGLSIANIVDPITQQNMPVIGQFYFITALLLFLYINGHHWLLAGIQTSYHAVPIGLNFPELTTAMLKLIELSSYMFVFAVMLVIPLLGVLFVTELALGFMGKVMPQMNIFIVGLPLKIYVGLIFMVLTLPMARFYIEDMFKVLSHYLYRLFV